MGEQRGKRGVVRVGRGLGEGGGGDGRKVTSNKEKGRGLWGNLEGIGGEKGRYCVNRSRRVIITGDMGVEERRREFLWGGETTKKGIGEIVGQ